MRFNHLNLGIITPQRGLAFRSRGEDDNTKQLRRHISPSPQIPISPRNAQQVVSRKILDFFKIDLKNIGHFFQYSVS